MTQDQDNRTDLQKETHVVVVRERIGIAVYAEEGWCPEHDRPCPWGCEMECFLQDAEWQEPTP